MPPPGINIPLKAGIKPIKDAFKEFEKQQKKLWKTRESQMREEKKHHKFEMDSIKVQSKEEMKSIKKMSDGINKINRQKDQERKQAQKFQRQQDRAREKAEREEKRGFLTRQRSMKQLNDGFRKSALGRFTTGTLKVGAAVGGGLLGLAAGAMIKGYQNWASFQQSLAPAIGVGGNVSQAAWGAGKGKGGALGFNVAERASLIPQMARATGTISPREMMQAMRSTAMSAGEVGDVFGTMRAGGAAFGKGGRGSKDFSEMIEGGMLAGFKRAELPKYFSSVTRLMQRQMQVSAGDVTARGFSELAAMLAKSGKSGLMRERGVQTLAAMQQAILAPQGEQNIAFMQRAMGFGVPGGRNDYFQAEVQREKGLDPENMQRVMKQLESEFGFGGEARGARLKLRELTGGAIGLERGKELIDLYKSGKGQEEKLKETKDILDKSKSLQQQAYEAMRDSGADLGHLVEQFDKSVELGSDIKEEIQALEDAQMKLTQIVIELLKDIRDAVQPVAQLLRDIIQWVKSLWGGDDETAKATGASAKGTDLIKKAKKAKTPAEKLKLLKLADQQFITQGGVYQSQLDEAIEDEDDEDIRMARAALRNSYTLQRKVMTRRAFWGAAPKNRKVTQEDQEAVERLLQDMSKISGQGTEYVAERSRLIEQYWGSVKNKKSKDKAAAEEVRDLERKREKRRKRDEQRKNKKDNQETGPKTGSLLQDDKGVKVSGVFELRGLGAGSARPVLSVRGDSDAA